MKALEILKAGKHTASNGREIFLTDLDLERAARAYDPALQKAPLVVGHPTMDAPAYGFVKSLTYSKGKLLAEPAKVDPEFAEMVNSGKYLSLSASLYAPDSPSNPRPGAYYLRHVGFLGAWPPAVKGLETPSFCDDDRYVLAFGDDSFYGFIPDITRYI